MSDLFQKISTLVQARLNSLLPDEQRPMPPLPALEQDVVTMRRKIREAQDYEAKLTARVVELQAEHSKWDEAADSALAKSDDVTARYAVMQGQLAQQRLVVAQADLVSHQGATQELVQRVGELESAVGDLRQAAPNEATAQPLQNVYNALQEIREQVRQVIDRSDASAEVSAASEPPVKPASPTAPAPVSAAPSVDDDLERRRKRLSKPGT